MSLGLWISIAIMLDIVGINENNLSGNYAVSSMIHFNVGASPLMMFSINDWSWRRMWCQSHRGKRTELKAYPTLRGNMGEPWSLAVNENRVWCRVWKVRDFCKLCIITVLIPYSSLIACIGRQSYQVARPHFALSDNIWPRLIWWQWNDLRWG